MTVAHDVQERAEALWDAALDAIPEPAAWIDGANEGLRAAGLVSHGQLVVRSARPRLLTVQACARDQSVVSAVTSALTAAADVVVADDEARERYLGPWARDPRLFDLLTLPSGYPQRVVLGRFDGFRAEAGVAVLEFNGGLPGGVMPTQASAGVMRTWSPFARLEESFSVTVPDLAERMLAAVVGAWHGFGGSGMPSMAFAVPHEMADFVATPLSFMVRLAEAAGATVIIRDPGDLTRAGGRLLADGRAIDVVVRVFFTSMLDSLGGRIDDLVAAVRAGEVCMVTSFHAGLLGHKSLFAVITDPTIDLGLTTQQRSLVAAHVPWTRMVIDGVTAGPDGDVESLLPLVERERERLVLKPADGTGGAGVHLGWETPPEQWTAALADALAAGTWIVQRRVPLSSVEVPVLEPGFPRIRFVDDHNPLVLDDAVAGYFVRLSETGGVTNMSTGAGTVVPTFFVDERE